MHDDIDEVVDRFDAMAKAGGLVQALLSARKLNCASAHFIAKHEGDATAYEVAQRTADSIIDTAADGIAVRPSTPQGSLGAVPFVFCFGLAVGLLIASVAVLR